jgi:hypothetical protein
VHKLLRTPILSTEAWDFSMRRIAAGHFLKTTMSQIIDQNKIVSNGSWHTRHDVARKQRGALQSLTIELARSCYLVTCGKMADKLIACFTSGSRHCGASC